MSGLPGAVERILEEGPPPLFDGERVAVVGGGRDWPTAQEAVLKLREGVRLAAEAHHTEQILHGHLAAIDETVRVFVLEGEGRAAERAGDVVRALGEIGAETTLVATEHPVGGHRALPAPHAGSRGEAGRRPGQDPLGRAALGRGASVLQLTAAQLGSTPRGW